MGLKLLAVGLVLLGLGMVGVAGIPALITGLLIVIGSIGVLAGY